MTETRSSSGYEGPDVHTRHITWFELEERYRGPSFEDRNGAIHMAQTARLDSTTIERLTKDRDEWEDVLSEARHADHTGQSTPRLDALRRLRQVQFLTGVGSEKFRSELDPRIRRNARKVLVQHVLPTLVANDADARWMVVDFFANDPRHTITSIPQARDRILAFLRKEWTYQKNGTDTDARFEPSVLDFMRARLVTATLRTRAFTLLVSPCRILDAIEPLYFFLVEGTERANALPPGTFPLVCGVWGGPIGTDSGTLDDVQEILAYAQENPTLLNEDRRSILAFCAKVLLVPNFKHPQLSTADFHTAARVLLELLATFEAWISMDPDHLAHAEEQHAMTAAASRVGTNDHPED